MHAYLQHILKQRVHIVVYFPFPFLLTFFLQHFILSNAPFSPHVLYGIPGEQAGGRKMENPGISIVLFPRDIPLTCLFSFSSLFTFSFSLPVSHLQLTFRHMENQVLKNSIFSSSLHTPLSSGLRRTCRYDVLFEYVYVCETLLT